MQRPRVKLCVAVLAAALGAAGMARAADPVASAGGTDAAPDPAAPPPTAAPAPMTTAQQIDAFVKGGGAPGQGASSELLTGAPADAPRDNRIHGVVEVGAGTGGYRHALVGAEVPLGSTGQLDITISEDRFQDRYRGWRGQAYAGALAFGAAADGPGCLPGHAVDPTVSRPWPLQDPVCSSPGVGSMVPMFGNWAR